MDTSLFIFISAFCLASVQSQEQLVQSSEPAVVKPGGSHKLSCKGSGFSMSSYWMYWVRQAPGGGLQWLGQIKSGTTYYADAIKVRFTISTDYSNNMLYLQMDNMKTEDTAMYYCARVGTGTAAMDIWGQGTTVLVTSAEIITPEVFPMIAVGQTDSTSISLSCLIKNYFPEPVNVIWSTTNGEILNGVKAFTTPLTGQPPAYNMLSQVTINNNDWNSNTYQCEVSHQSTSIQKIIPKGYVTFPEAPSVYLLQGTCPENNNGEIELSCQVYNLTSQEATLKWYINDQERRLPQDILELGKSQINFFALNSKVTISQSEWNNGVHVKCHVTDPKTGKTAEDTIKKCSESFNCLGINVFMVQPSIEELYVHNTARVACVASNLKNTNENYSFKWSFPGASSILNVQTEDPVLQENGTYSVSSVLNISPDVWEQETEFTCVFNHNGLQTPIITRISKEKGAKMSQPMVSVFPPSAEELAQKETCTLICIGYNFSPINIFMGWTENDMEVSKHFYVNSEPKLETNRSTYFILSKLTIPVSAWDSGSNYACIVGHETIPMKFTRRSIDKNSGKPTVVNMSVTMSDTTLSCY